MARSLTFSQVREAGEYAWHPLPGGDPFRPYLVYLGVSDEVRVATRDLTGDELWGPRYAEWQIPQDGWRHLEDCDCEHCCRHVELWSWQAEADWEPRTGAEENWPPPLAPRRRALLAVLGDGSEELRLA